MPAEARIRERIRLCRAEVKKILQDGCSTAEIVAKLQDRYTEVLKKWIKDGADLDAPILKVA